MACSNSWSNLTGYLEDDNRFAEESPVPSISVLLVNECLAMLRVLETLKNEMSVAGSTGVLTCGQPNFER